MGGNKNTGKRLPSEELFDRAISSYPMSLENMQMVYMCHAKTYGLNEHDAAGAVRDAYKENDRYFLRPHDVNAHISQIGKAEFCISKYDCLFQLNKLMRSVDPKVFMEGVQYDRKETFTKFLANEQTAEIYHAQEKVAGLHPLASDICKSMYKSTEGDISRSKRHLVEYDELGQFRPPVIAANVPKNEHGVA